MFCAKLAEGSRRILIPYRQGHAVDDTCALQRALTELRAEEG